MNVFTSTVKLECDRRLSRTSCGDVDMHTRTHEHTHTRTHAHTHTHLHIKALPRQLQL